MFKTLSAAVLTLAMVCAGCGPRQEVVLAPGGDPVTDSAVVTAANALYDTETILVSTIRLSQSLFKQDRISNQEFSKVLVAGRKAEASMLAARAALSNFALFRSQRFEDKLTEALALLAVTTDTLVDVRKALEENR